MNNSTDSDLKSLTLKRGHLKGQLTRFTNFLANFSDQSEIMELQSRLERVEPLFGEFNQLQMQIENLSEN